MIGALVPALLLPSQATAQVLVARSRPAVHNDTDARPAEAQASAPSPAHPPSPPPSPPPPSPPRRERHVGEGLWSGWTTVHSMEGTTLGLEAYGARVAGGGPARAAGGAWVGMLAEITGRSWYPSDDKMFRFRLETAFGGGWSRATGAGVDQALATEGAVGFRLPFGKLPLLNPFRTSSLYRSMDDETRSALDAAVFARSPHALFARGGYGLGLWSLGPVYRSTVDVPRLEAGYHYDGGSRVAVEARLEGGLVLAGRLAEGDERHRLGGSLFWGGKLTVHAPLAHVQIAARRVEAGGALGPADEAESRVCLRLGRRHEGFGDHPRFLLCSHQRFDRGMVAADGEAPRELASLYSGVFFGFDGID